MILIVTCAILFNRPTCKFLGGAVVLFMFLPSADD